MKKVIRSFTVDKSLDSDLRKLSLSLNISLFVNEKLFLFVDVYKRGGLGREMMKKNYRR